MRTLRAGDRPRERRDWKYRLFHTIHSCLEQDRCTTEYCRRFYDRMMTIMDDEWRDFDARQRRDVLPSVRINLYGRANGYCHECGRWSRDHQGYRCRRCGLKLYAGPRVNRRSWEASFVNGAITEFAAYHGIITARKEGVILPVVFCLGRDRTREVLRPQEPGETMVV